MSSKIKLVKKGKVDSTSPVSANDHVMTEQQLNRQIVGVIKGWIDEFKVRRTSEMQSALLMLSR